MAKKQLELEGVDAQSKLGKLLSEKNQHIDAITERTTAMAPLDTDILEEMKKTELFEVTCDGRTFYRKKAKLSLGYRKKREIEKPESAETE